MRVIPVIDLKQGVVVRGVAGRREEYRPVESILCSDASPDGVGRAFAELGFREAYVADLDAIAGAPPATPIYQELMKAGLDLWVDAGLQDVDRAAELARFEAGSRRLTGIIAGLESLDGPQTLAGICRAVGAERMIFSLDLKHGEPLVGSTAWQGLSAEQIAALALRCGVRRMIVLDLARVGVGQGVGTESLCRTLRCLAPQLEITAGGGVRSPADLDSLARAGCDAALVASALHDGHLSVGQALRA